MPALLDEDYIYDMKQLPILLIFLLSTLIVYSQPTEKAMVLTGYGEVYYGYDFGRPQDNSRPSFVYSHNRHNEVTVNLAMLHAAYNKNRVRANIGVMAGTYANANLAAEPGVLKNIYEANVGIKLAKKRDLWLDAGIIPSHIGPEGAISMDCPTLTRSLVAEASPYYESGVRLSYTTLNNKWYFALLHLNGWQRIQRPDGYSRPNGGMQITYTPNKNTVYNLSTYVGSDMPDSLKEWRYFIDLYMTKKFLKRFEVTGVLDMGYSEYQQITRGGRTGGEWLVSALMLKYNINKKMSVVGRVEYMVDDQNIIFGGGGFSPFEISGISLGFDRYITKGVLWRVEGKTYQDKNGIRSFFRDGMPVTDNYLLTTSLAVKFSNLKQHK